MQCSMTFWKCCTYTQQKKKPNELICSNLLRLRFFFGTVYWLNLKNCMKHQWISDAQEMANGILQVMFLGITGFHFPVAHFAVADTMPSLISTIIWKCLDKLIEWGFEVSLNIFPKNGNIQLLQLQLYKCV